MKIKAIYDNEADIPEQYKDLYTERDGKWLLTNVEGLQTDANVKRLETALASERKATKEFKDKLAKFGDLDPDEVNEKLDKFAELEIRASGNLDEKKVQELVDQRVAREKAVLDRQVKKLTEERDVAQGKVKELSGVITSSKIESSIRKAAEGAKVNVTAIEDIVLLAERLFEVTEDGKIVTKDNVGVTPGIEAEVWLGDMKEKRPHWWPESQGGGAKGSGGVKQFGNNPWTKANWNLTEQGRIVKENPQRAEQMAAAAGSKVGMSRPPEK